ncbi:M23 family metallopeptidase [Roseibium aestuarii]|uniref:Peptidoglycan DD-metalloendopeptidase family protein n=1 Tax=Roseibium aestuarii TaxID=2600299 RepID=A0ABW4JUF2_9HYPH|nr:M23 family metallopeptidase [Roseibium aestuarii]
MSKRLRLLHCDLISRVAVISMTAGVLAGCSAATERFGSEFYTGSTANQRQILSGNVRQPSYQDIMNGNGGTSAGLPPASGAPTSTGSVPVRGPVVDVQPRHLPNGNVGGQAPRQVASSGYGAPVAPVASSSSRGAVESRSLPAPVASAPISSSPAPAQAQVARAEPAPTAGRSWKGWTSTGGTVVPLRNGETVATVSRRYGVPAEAIVAVNGLQDASQVRPGQSLIIPVYVYGNGTSATASAGNSLPPAGSSDGLTTGSVNAAQPAPAQPSYRDVASATPVSAVPAPKPRGARTQSAAVAQPVRSEPVQAAATKPVVVQPRVETKAQTETRPAAPVERQQVAALDPAATKPAIETSSGNAGGALFRWPVRGELLSDFGAKPGGSVNDGINVAVAEGTPVQAAGDGTVIYSGNELKGYGNLVLVRHEDGWVSAYAHNSKLNVKRGDKVRQGDVVGLAGATGSVSQPQVHFELRKENKPVDPLRYLPKG